MRASCALVPALLIALGLAGEVRAEGPLSVHAGSEMAVYQDTDATTVVSPVWLTGQVDAPACERAAAAQQN